MKWKDIVECMSEGRGEGQDNSRLIRIEKARDS